MNNFNDFQTCLDNDHHDWLCRLGNFEIPLDYDAGPGLMGDSLIAGTNVPILENFVPLESLNSNEELPCEFSWDIAHESGPFQLALNASMPFETTSGIVESLPTPANQEGSKFPTPGTQITWRDREVMEPAAPTNSQKRKWETSMTAFPANPESAVTIKRRKPFDPSRKKEVARNRLVGACLVCKVRRGPCNFGIPCDGCIKRAGSLTLAQELCTRHGLVGIRFSNIDLFRVKAFEGLLEASTAPVIATQYICLPYTACCGNNEIQVHSADAVLAIRERHHQSVTSSLRTMTCMWRSRSKIVLGSTQLESHAGRSSLEVIVQRDPISCHDGITGPFARLHKAFGSFAERYSTTWPDPQTPYPLLSKTLRLNRILDTYHKATNVLDLSRLTPEHTDSIATFRFKYHSAKASVEQELEVLSDLDRLLYTHESTESRNGLLTWTCLWLLILSYKEHMDLFSYFHERDREVLEPLYGLARHMYNALTSIYTAVFKQSTPLSLDWRTEVSSMLGHDAELVDLFCNIKTAMVEFYADKDRLSPEDLLFKTLVVENDCKLTSHEIKCR